MACFVNEEEVWQCLKHPSKRRKTGICPTCLRERLATLCPECGRNLPCSCYQVPADSMSISSSSLTLFQFPGGSTAESGRMSTLIDREPAFRKSRSLAIPILRSRSKYDREVVDVVKKHIPNVSRRKVNLWSIFKVSKTINCDLHDDESNRSDVVSGATEDYSRMMRSRSVAVDAGDTFIPATAKRRGWYIPSPMKAFRQSKTSNLRIHERSPMHRG